MLQYQLCDANFCILNVCVVSISFRLLQRSDWYTQQKACRLLAIILDSRPDSSLGNLDAVAAEGIDQVCKHARICVLVVSV